MIASLKQAGLALDIDTASGQVGQWFHDVAHQRIHGKTQQKPEVLLIKEKLALSELPEKPIADNAIAAVTYHALLIVSFQHPLSFYD
ncbi:MAG: hypothetical protein ACI9MS_003142 [Glaciecola sp.]